MFRGSSEWRVFQLSEMEQWKVFQRQRHRHRRRRLVVFEQCIQP